jgi:histidine triad (HIT) family protein
VNGCLFCRIASGQSESNKIFENEDVFGFMDILPMTPGHCLVIPKTHIQDIFELPDELSGKIMRACRDVAKLITAKLEPLGINLVNNNGAHADQTQFHLPVHIIPRYGRDRLLHPWERSYGNPQQIKKVAEVIRGERDITELGSSG